MSSARIKLSSLAFATLLITSVAGCATGGDASDQDAEASWRETIATMPTADGCFQATYPSMNWEPVACTAAPSRPIGSPHAKLSAPGASALDGGFLVGNGADYALHVPGLISTSTGLELDQRRRG